MVCLYSPCRLLLLAGAWLTVASAMQPAKDNHGSDKIRTVVTTDMEQDDLASLIRYLLYTPDLDTQGIIYSSSRYHWQGDFKGTEFYLPGREYTTPQTSFRWTGNTTIQEVVIPAYAQIYSNLRVHDAAFPSPSQLLSVVKIGNVDFEGEYDHDTDGSDLIKSLILDHDPRPLYLQAWGGTNTIARALKSIEEQFMKRNDWVDLKAKVSEKVIILASGFQDETYDNYISITWPELQVRSSGVPWTTYNCANINSEPARKTLDNRIYFEGDWIRQYIQTGPYGKLYRSWLDKQHMAGDQLDFFGNTTDFPIPADLWCKPLSPYDFLGEGDDGTYLPLLTTGLQDPSNPSLGGWGGRAVRNKTVAANLLQTSTAERSANGSLVKGYGTSRFISAAQNDFAARMSWTLTSEYDQSNHPPRVSIAQGSNAKACAGSNITLESTVSDPDGDRVSISWWQYLEEGTYNGTVVLKEAASGNVVVGIPSDAKVGQTISIVLQGTDDGQFPLTRYDRIMLEVE